MIITIHQPNFIPWYPFFQKMQMADKFVFLTHCQYRKNYFQNRFNLEDKWHTMSVDRGLINISEKQYVNYKKDWMRIKENLKKYQDVLSEFDDCISSSMSETNIKIIKKISKLLDIDVEFEYDVLTNLKSNERLIDICLRNCADTYIAGTGSMNYIQVDKFLNSGISVIFQKEEDKQQKSILEILDGR